MEQSGTSSAKGKWQKRAAISRRAQYLSNFSRKVSRPNIVTRSVSRFAPEKKCAGEALPVALLFFSVVQKNIRRRKLFLTQFSRAIDFHVGRSWPPERYIRARSPWHVPAKLEIQTSKFQLSTLFPSFPPFSNSHSRAPHNWYLESVIDFFPICP